MSRLILLLALTLSLALGCASTPAEPANGTAPPFTIKLRAHTADHRFTYFEIDKVGNMRFGGGRDGALFESKPDIKLTAEQRDTLWAILKDQKVAESENFPFADFKTAEYHADIWTGGALGRSFRSIDDKSPGVKALADLLFKYHLDAGVNLPGLAK